MRDHPLPVSCPLLLAAAFLVAPAAGCSGSIYDVNGSPDGGARPPPPASDGGKPGGSGWVRALRPLRVGALATDAQGNVIVGGAFGGGGFDIGLGSLPASPLNNLDAVVVGLSPSGEPRWNVAFQSPADAVVSAVAADAAGNVFAARTVSPTAPGEKPLPPGTPQAFLDKLDANGHALYDLAFPTSEDASVRLVKLEVEPGGDVLLAGDVRGTVDFGTGPLGDPTTAALVARFAGDTGAVRWALAIPGATSEGLALGAPGELVIGFHAGAGFSLGGVSFTDEEVSAAGFFLASLDLGGQVKSVRNHAGGDIAIAAAPDGSIAAASHCTSGGSKSWCMAGFDALGNPRWTTWAGGPNPSSGDGARIAVGANGNVVLASEAYDFADTQKPFGQHLYVTRANAAGATLSVTDWHSEASLAPGGLAVDSTGAILVGGYFDGSLPGTSVDLGAGRIAGSTGFVVKLAPE